MTVVTEAPQVAPGVYDIPAELYHADPIPGGSLSSTGARKLLDCPAKFKHEQDNPPEPKKVFEFGTAAHKLVLGEGPDLVLIDADEWRTAAVKAKVAAVRAAGGVPLKPDEYKQVHAMADAIRRHPIAGALFSPDRGESEQSLFWRDQPTGIWRRARLDWLDNDHPGRIVIGDYKTTRSAHPADIQKSVHDYGYHQQAAWYLDGVTALGLADNPVFIFVFQEKTAPYVVTVTELDAVSLRYGRHYNRQAIDRYVHCRETGHWPGYSEQIESTPLPYWVERQFLEETS